MRVAELHIYPVKGAAGIAVPRLGLEAAGPADDRRWMIVDAGGGFVTQREHPHLVLVRVTLEPDALVLQSPAAGTARVPRQADGAVRRVRVWGDEVDAVDTGDAAADVLSRHLGLPVRLVHLPDWSVRPVDPDYGQPGDRVSFADGFPLLLIGQASLDALNARLAEPVPMLRFRPNVVVRGAAAAHAEDTWRAVRLGSVECDVVKPCARCVVTTVDQATGVTGAEPLRAMAQYRRWDGKVWFGQNVVHRGTGTLAVGDDVQVLETGEPRPDPAGSHSG
jgi:uncharacterized protein